MVIKIWLSSFLLLGISLIPLNTEASPSELYQFLTELRADEGSLYRFYSVVNSPERRLRMQEFFKSKASSLHSFKFEDLSNSGKVDFVLADKYLKYHLERLDIEESECDKIGQWMSPVQPIYNLEKMRRRGRKLDWASVAKLYDAVSGDLAAKKREAKDPVKKLHPDLIRRGSQSIKGISSAIKSIHEFYSGYDPEYSWWMDKPYISLQKDLVSYEIAFGGMVDSTLLNKDDGSGIHGRPIGIEGLNRLLSKELITYSPAELVKIAELEFAWCDKQIREASKAMGFGDDWKKAQEKVKKTYVAPGQQPEMMFKIYEQSVEFLKKNEMISIPPLAEETWRMDMISPERQLISPFFLGGEILQIAFPTEEMEHADKLMSMRGNNPHFSKAVIHHELIAGHHLQQFMNRRNNNYRNFYTPFWMEGWALYWEMLLWDNGFATSPEDKIGMLFWRMHRCARIIFSVKYHTREWTPQECIDFLVERVGHERSTAEGEVRRSFTGNYGPLYQIAYMIGGLQFYELKREMVDSGKMNLRQFHDRIMEENMMPVEILRFLINGTDPKKDYEANWRFYPAIK